MSQQRVNFFLSVVLVSLAAATTLAGRVYFAIYDDGDIAECTLSGGSPDVLYSAGPGETYVPYGVAYDPNNDFIYWADDGELCRAEADGTGSVDVIYSSTNPRDVALNPAGTRLYWTDTTLETINSLNLNTFVNTVLFSGSSDNVNEPHGVVADTANDYIYWSEDGYVKRGALDGSGSGSSIYSTAGVCDGLAIDVANGKLYWAERNDCYNDDLIRRSNLDGSSLTTLYSGSEQCGIVPAYGDCRNPVDVGLDVASGKIYWSQNGLIKKANLDGSGSVTTILGSLGAVKGIAIKP